MCVGLFMMRPVLSYADWSGNNGNGGNWHGNGNAGNSHQASGHEGHGNDGHGYGGGHSYIGVDFSLWPDSYYYGSAYYPPTDEVLVSPPVYQPVVINGSTYYLNDGTYYIYNGYGYQAVAPPVAVVQPPPVITSAGPASDMPDSITINIPNNKGGYTAVTLKRSGNGYIGPQGEFYPEFPKVSQLEIIYGK